MIISIEQQQYIYKLTNLQYFLEEKQHVLLFLQNELHEPAEENTNCKKADFMEE
jgi:hypothetical protein